MSKLVSLVVVAVTLGIAATAAGGAEGGYPARPIRLVVPSPAGGGMDRLARAIAQPLTERWGQQVVVDPRPGATGIIGTDIVHVPYKGTPPAMIDLIAGRISLMFAAAPALPHVSAGKLRAVAVTTARRSPSLPDLPAAAEAVPGFDAETWYGLLAPAGIPPRIVASLHAEISQFLRDGVISRRLAGQGFDIVASTPAEFSRYLQSEIGKWRKVIQTSGIKPE